MSRDTVTRADLDTLGDALVEATRDGYRFPDDGRFYYVAYTYLDGVDVEPGLLTMQAARDRADLCQRLVNASGNHLRFCYVVRTRDHDRVVYHAEGSPDVTD